MCSTLKRRDNSCFHAVSTWNTYGVFVGFILLSLILKVKLRSIHGQAQDYLQRNKLLYIYQSDFRANRFTDTCLSQLTEMTLNGAENGKYAGMTLISLQEAFDTLTH